MSRGVLIYAHNNNEIDYLKIACANALMIDKNLNVPVSIVTDKGTLEWSEKNLGKSFIDECFDKIIITDRNYNFDNIRNFSDTSNTTKKLQFYNCNHWEAYELSPYDETLFIDADYLIMSKALNNCWGSLNDVMIGHEIYSPLDNDFPKTKYIDDFGIKMYWATVIYFRKTEFSKFLFSMVKHIQENYRYYKDLYYFSNGLYRNDYAFSIAVHTLNGFVDTPYSVVGNLPIPGLLMSWETNDVYSVNGINDITLYVEKQKEKSSYILARIKNTDIHIMNKWAINRFSDKLIELYKKDYDE
jgi:hypothetical protein